MSLTTTRVQRDMAPDSLSGRDRAAIVLLAMGMEQSSRLIGMMGEEEIKDISSAMASLGAVPASTVDALCTRFVGDVVNRGGLVGSVDATERLLLATLPQDRAIQILDEIRGPAGRTMWEKLAGVNETVLANYLKNEYPQTVAVVLSKIEPDHAGRVLGLLPETFAIEVVMRMLRMESVQRDVLDGVERTLRSEFMTNLSRTRRRDSHEMMAEIFNSLDRQTESRFVSALEERNREAADRIKALMFTFEDLGRLSPQHVQVLLRAVEKDKLPLALKGASEPVRDMFFRNLSERAGRMLQDDIASLGPVKLRDVDEAQAGIVTLAKQLAASGEIEISEGAADEMVE